MFGKAPPGGMVLAWHGTQSRRFIWTRVFLQHSCTTNDLTTKAAVARPRYHLTALTGAILTGR
jgi:hypothetical protein